MPNNLSPSKELKSSIEEIMKETHYENFDEWVTNFAINLENIWDEKSAKNLQPLNSENLRNGKNSAIVIGRGPSIKKYDHLKLLADSNYQGNIVCCDGALSNALKAGVTPDRFQKFFVTTKSSSKTITFPY